MEMERPPKYLSTRLNLQPPPVGKIARAVVAVLFFVQTRPNGLGELVNQKWLGQKIDAFLQDQIFSGYLGAVTASVDDFQFGIFQHEPVGEFFSIHAVWQHHVGQQQVNFVPVFFPYVQSIGAV